MPCGTEKQEEHLKVRGGQVKSTEQWRPGEVDITKLKKRFFPYLVTSGLDPPPYKEIALPVTDASPRPIATSAQRWARRLERWKVLRASNQLEANAIEEAITEAMLDSGASKHLSIQDEECNSPDHPIKLLSLPTEPSFQCPLLRCSQPAPSPRVPGRQ